MASREGEAKQAQTPSGSSGSGGGGGIAPGLARKRKRIRERRGDSVEDFITYLCRGISLKDRKRSEQRRRLALKASGQMLA